MGNDALQALSKRYAHGEISRPEYRLQRQIIIDQVTGYIRENSNETNEADIIRPTAHSTPAPKPFLKAGVISAAIVVILILMYVTI